MTPPRLSQLECPACRASRWTIDPDSYGRIRNKNIARGERVYVCPHCGYKGAGWTLLLQAPVSFFFQPDDEHPMTEEEFDRWVTILKIHFPDHPRLAELGRSFFPRTPEQAAARKAQKREEHLRTHPIVEMRGSRRSRAYPEDYEAKDWLTLVRPGNPLSFLHRDGGKLVIDAPPDGRFSLRLLGPDDRVLAENLIPDSEAVQKVMFQYLRGNTNGVLKTIQPEPVDPLSRNATVETIDHAAGPVVVVSFRGAYASGSAGNESAHAMVTFLRSVLAEKVPAAVVLDLTGVDYVWGDAICELAMPFLEKGKGFQPPALVAAGRTAQALEPLLESNFLLGIAGMKLFPTRQDALAHVRDALDRSR